jgi:hypothetical protein
MGRCWRCHKIVSIEGVIIKLRLPEMRLTFDHILYNSFKVQLLSR